MAALMAALTAAWMVDQTAVLKDVLLVVYSAQK